MAIEKVIAALITAAGVVLLSTAAAARDEHSCVTDSEFDEAFEPAVESGAVSISTVRFGSRPLCSGKTFAQRLQELRQRYFPFEELDRRRSLAERVADDRYERELADARAAREQARRDELDDALYKADLAEARVRARRVVRDYQRYEERADAEHRVALAEAEWRSALARSKSAQANLSQAEAQRQLASLPPPSRAGAIRVVPAVAISGREMQKGREALDSFLRDSSGDWPKARQYKTGSVRDLEVYAREHDPSIYTMAARFKYRDGSDGWVEIEHDGHRFTDAFISGEGGEAEPGWFESSLNVVTDFGKNVLGNVAASLLIKIVTRGRG